MLLSRAKRHVVTALLNMPLLVLLLLSACSYPLYPSTAGSHAPPSKGDIGARYVVWSNHPGVGQHITSLLLAGGHPVVERSRLDALFTEQRVTLSHTRDEDVLRVGRLVGATHVIFAEVHGVEPPLYPMIDRPPRQSVAIRSVAVESGEVRWTGFAAYPEPSSNPEQSVIGLTYWAIARALCEGTWEEHTANQDGGCRKLVPAQEAKQDKPIWGEMQKMELAEYQWLMSEKQALDHEKQALDKRRAEIAADTDLQRLGPKQQVLAEYSQRLAEYEKRVAAYNQRVATYNQRNAEAAGQPR
jgi:hypothetical protein